MALALVAIAVVVPAIQVLAVRWIDPPFTITMIEKCSGGGFMERVPVRLNALPAHVPRAFVSAEDQRFYAHRGFDWEAIQAAMDHNREGGTTRGASTISQQVARNVFLWQRRSWARKGLETWYTLWLEALVPKDRILELYLNVAQTGPCTFGVEAGARRWFGVAAARLTPRQAAQLAALLPSPARWTPKSAHVRKRAEWILAHPAPMSRAAAQDLQRRSK